MQYSKKNYNSNNNKLLLNVIIFTEESAIFLQPRCFQNPEKHIYHLYTNSDIQVLKQYFEGNGSNVFNITVKSIYLWFLKFS